MAKDTSPTPERVQLGVIGRVHGIKGDVVITSYTEPPENIAGYGPLSDGSGRRTFELRILRAKGEQVFAHIAGIDDRTTAETLRGIELFVDRKRLPPVDDDDEFYHADLIGLAAITPDGDRFAEVVAVQNFGAGDLLELRFGNSKKTEFIPFSATWVPSVDLDARTITVVLPTSEDQEDDSREAGGET